MAVKPRTAKNSHRGRPWYLRMAPLSQNQPVMSVAVTIHMPTMRPECMKPMGR